MEAFSGGWDAGGCLGLHQSGLYLGERIFGGSEAYCVCDTGLCAPGTETPATLVADTYEGTFARDGSNWDGPSDTSNPKGALVPKGRYTLQVRSTGMASDGADFEVLGALTFTLE